MSRKCSLCRMPAGDRVKLGEFMVQGKIAVHYYCLLLSSTLVQNGTDNEGFLGFLPKDILVEEQRVAKEICNYCHKAYANISCCGTKCHRQFHLLCGLENKAVCQFTNTFKSFCGRHHKDNKKKCSYNDECVICCEKMGHYNRANSIFSPCCKSGWYHKWCLAEYALNAGYFFKCPLCNNKDVFKKKLVYRGIFVPDQDAAWELEANAFADLLERPDECSAEKCVCPKGRKFDKKPFDQVICGTCGSKCIHIPCMQVPSESYSCDECAQLLNSVDNQNEHLSNSTNNNVPDENNKIEDDVIVDDESIKNNSDDNEKSDSEDSILFTFSRNRVAVIESDTESINLSPHSSKHEEDISNRHESDEKSSSSSLCVSGDYVNAIFKKLRRKRHIPESDDTASIFSMNSSSSDIIVRPPKRKLLNRMCHSLDIYSSTGSNIPNHTQNNKKSLKDTLNHPPINLRNRQNSVHDETENLFSDSTDDSSPECKIRRSSRLKAVNEPPKLRRSLRIRSKSLDMISVNDNTLNGSYSKDNNSVVDHDMVDKKYTALPSKSSVCLAVEKDLWTYLSHTKKLHRDANENPESHENFTTSTDSLIENKTPSKQIKEWEIFFQEINRNTSNYKTQKRSYKKRKLNDGRMFIQTRLDNFYNCV